MWSCISRMKPTSIYALIDPRDSAIKYVGKTLQSIDSRLATHLSYAKKGLHTYCARWLKGLLDAGLRPEVQILEVVETEHWAERECFWIAELSRLGCSLTNLTAGGDGMNSYRHTESARQKMSAASKRYIAEHGHPSLGKKRTPEQLLRFSKAQKGRVITPESRAKISASLAGKPLPLETRAKISASLKGRAKPARTAEHCQKIAERATGRTRSEETKAAVSAKLKGREFSEEHRRKLSEAAKRRRVES